MLLSLPSSCERLFVFSSFGSITQISLTTALLFPSNWNLVSLDERSLPRTTGEDSAELTGFSDVPLTSSHHVWLPHTNPSYASTHSEPGTTILYPSISSQPEITCISSRLGNSPPLDRQYLICLMGTPLIRTFWSATGASIEVYEHSSTPPHAAVMWLVRAECDLPPYLDPTL